MCMKNVVRRFGAFLSALVLCFSLTVPALADEVLEGTLSLIEIYRPSSSSSFSPLNTVSFSFPGSTSFNVPPPFTSSFNAFAFSQVPLSDFLSDGVTLGVYFSLYYESTAGAKQNKVPEKNDFCLQATYSGESYYRTFYSSSFSTFAPASSYNSVSDGGSWVLRFEDDIGKPASALALYPGGSAYLVPKWYFETISGDFPSDSSQNHIVVPSFRIISSATSAELDALESMASAIAAQNQILSAYYGDIVAICNQIYQRLGDMQQTQIEANALLSSLVSLLDTTNGKISALNQAMSTYFDLVLKSLQNESLSIQDCINDAELRLETYLKPIVDYFTELEETTGESASSLPGHKTDLDKWSSDSTGIDADAQTGLAAILPVLTAFSFIFQILGIFIGLGILSVIIRKGLS